MNKIESGDKMKKFAVTVFRPTKISDEDIKHIGHTKIFDTTSTLSEIMDFANKIKMTSDVGKKVADITDLTFSCLWDE